MTTREQVHAEVNLEVPAEASVEAGHAVAVRTRLVERVGQLDDAIVHIDAPGAPGEIHHEALERQGHAHGHEGPPTLTRRPASRGSGLGRGRLSGAACPRRRGAGIGASS